MSFKFQKIPVVLLELFREQQPISFQQYCHRQYKSPNQSCLLLITDRQAGRQVGRQAGRWVVRQAGRQAGSLQTGFHRFTEIGQIFCNKYIV